MSVQLVEKIPIFGSFFGLTSFVRKMIQKLGFFRLALGRGCHFYYFVFGSIWYFYKKVQVREQTMKIRCRGFAAASYIIFFLFFLRGLRLRKPPWRLRCAQSTFGCAITFFNFEIIIMIFYNLRFKNLKIHLSNTPLQIHT